MNSIKTFLLLAFVGISMSVNAQTAFKVPASLYTGFPDSTRKLIITSLDKLLNGIEAGTMDEALIDKDNFSFNRTFFKYLKGLGDKDTIGGYFQAQLINLYPIAPSQYALTMGYVGDHEIGRMFTFIAKEVNGSIVFANPIKCNTAYWKTKKVGTVTFYYRDIINMKQAENLDRKNRVMASKLKLPVMSLEMYMCRDYQEVLKLQGCDYDFSSNGVVNSGDIVDPVTVFSVMNNEDFSHDVLHMYAANIRGMVRNTAAEEGIAYSWGNAYHAGSNGHVPEQQELVLALRQYVKAHPEAKLLDLFDKNPNVLAEYGFSKPVAVKAVISGIICDEVERQKGSAGIIELLKCGRGDESYFKCIDRLVQINRANFEKRVSALLFQ